MVVFKFISKFSNIKLTDYFFCLKRTLMFSSCRVVYLHNRGVIKKNLKLSKLLCYEKMFFFFFFFYEPIKSSRWNRIAKPKTQKAMTKLESKWLLIIFNFVLHMVINNFVFQNDYFKFVLQMAITKNKVWKSQKKLRVRPRLSQY
jgi:hypothetical protein